MLFFLTQFWKLYCKRKIAEHDASWIGWMFRVHDGDVNSFQLVGAGVAMWVGDGGLGSFVHDMFGHANTNTSGKVGMLLGVSIELEVHSLQLRNLGPPPPAQ